MEKKEIMETLAKEVETKCNENGIEYLLMLSEETAGKFISFNAAKDVVLKEVIALATKLVPNK